MGGSDAVASLGSVVSALLPWRGQTQRTGLRPQPRSLYRFAIAEAHGDRIDVQSDETETIFTFRIPLIEQSSATATSASGGLPRSGHSSCHPIFAGQHSTPSQSLRTTWKIPENSHSSQHGDFGFAPHSAAHRLGTTPKSRSSANLCQGLDGGLRSGCLFSEAPENGRRSNKGSGFCPS